MDIRVGDKVRMNGRYDDMPNDGKIYEVYKVGNVGRFQCVWIPGMGAFLRDGFERVVVNEQ